MSFQEEVRSDLISYELPAIWPHTKSCLQIKGIHTIGSLLDRSETDILKIPGISCAALDNIKAALAELGLFLKAPEPGDPTPDSLVNTQAITELPYMDGYVAKRLRSAGVIYVGQLLSMTQADLAKIRCIGPARAQYINNAMSACGWQLKEPPAPACRDE